MNIMSARSLPRQMPGLEPGEALLRILAPVLPLHEEEKIAITAACGRVLAQDMSAQEALPRFASSAMDGYGLHEWDRANGIGKVLPIIRVIHAGKMVEPAVLQPGEAVRLTTGAVVPDGVAAIIPDEDGQVVPGGVRFSILPKVGANIRRRGEDVEIDAVVAASGAILTPPQLMLLAAAGISHVPVRRRVRIGLLSSGNELVEPGDGATMGQIVDSNRIMLKHLLAGPSTDLVDFGIVPDRLSRFGEVIKTTGDLDLLITTGGAANSEADIVAKELRLAGGEVETLILDLKPGRRLGHGALGRTHVLCLPGNPVAALVTALLFALPLVHRLLDRVWKPDWQDVKMLASISSRAGRTEFAPARLVRNSAGGIEGAAPMGVNESHRLMPLAQADGFVCIPPERSAIDVGATLPFLPMGSIFGNALGTPG